MAWSVGGIMNNTLIEYGFLGAIGLLSFLSIFFLFLHLKSKKSEKTPADANTPHVQSSSAAQAVHSDENPIMVRINNLRTELNQGKISKSSLITLSVIGILAFFLLFTISGFKMLFVSFLLMVLIVAVPQIMLYMKKNKFIEKFNEELVDTLEILSNAMKAGNSFGQALEVASKEIGEPIAEDLKEIVRRNKMGVSFSELMTQFMDKYPEMHELKLSVTAINISLEVGGNLTVILSKISQTMKDRKKIKKKIGAMTAQGMLSAFVAGAAPWVMIGVMYMVQPGMMSIMFETMIGNIILIIVLLLDAVGIFFIRKISSVEV